MAMMPKKIRGEHPTMIALWIRCSVLICFFILVTLASASWDPAAAAIEAAEAEEAAALRAATSDAVALAMAAAAEESGGGGWDTAMYLGTTFGSLVAAVLLIFMGWALQRAALKCKGRRGLLNF